MVYPFHSTTVPFPFRDKMESQHKRTDAKAQPVIFHSP